MAQDFIAPASKVTDKIVAEATSFEAMVEGLRRANGVNKSHFDPFSGRNWEVTPEQQPIEQQRQVAAAALSATNGFEFEKEIRFHESTGKQALVIRAHTEEDLRRLEAQILYGR